MRKKVRMVCWTKPPVGIIKLNIDGSLRNRRGTWGAASRDSNGDLFKTAYGSSIWTAIDEIEMDRIEQGLRLAGKYGIKDINVDSSIVVHYLKTTKPPWHLGGMVEKIKGEMNNLNSYVLEHCYR